MDVGVQSATEAKLGSEGSTVRVRDNKNTQTHVQNLLDKERL